MLPVRLLIIMSLLCGSLATATVAARHAHGALPLQYNCLHVGAFQLRLNGNVAQPAWRATQPPTYSHDGRYYYQEQRGNLLVYDPEIRLAVVDTLTNTTRVLFTGTDLDSYSARWLPQHNVVLLMHTRRGNPPGPRQIYRLYHADGRLIVSTADVFRHYGDSITYQANGDVVIYFTNADGNYFRLLPLDGRPASRVYIEDFAGGSAVHVRAPHPTAPSMAVAQHDQVIVMDFARTIQHTVPYARLIGDGAGPHRLRWSPDGTRLLLTLTAGRGYLDETGEIATLDWHPNHGLTLTHQFAVPLGPLGDRYDYATWSPDSQHIDYERTIYGFDQTFQRELLRFDVNTGTTSSLASNVVRLSNPAAPVQLIQHMHAGAPHISRITAAGLQTIVSAHADPFSRVEWSGTANAGALYDLWVSGSTNTIRLVMVDAHGRIVYPPPGSTSTRQIVEARHDEIFLVAVGPVSDMNYELVDVQRGLVFGLPHAMGVTLNWQSAIQMQPTRFGRADDTTLIAGGNSLYVYHDGTWHGVESHDQIDATLLSPDGARLAIERHNGQLDVYDLETAHLHRLPYSPSTYSGHLTTATWTQCGTVGEQLIDYYRIDY